MRKKIEEDIVIKYLTGTLSEDEKKKLDEWLSDDASNAELLSGLKDSDLLEEGYRHWRSINHDRPHRDMTGRIKLGKTRFRVGAMAAAAVAAIVLLVASLIALRRSELNYDSLLASMQTEKYMTTIHHGVTKATLTTDDGKVVALGSDEKDNDDVLKAISQKKLESDQKIQEQKDRAAMNSLEIPRGGEFHITLEDGTEVWLNAESSLKYPEHFNGPSREVEMTGEAYFKVRKDESRLFYVRVAGQRICVHGTEFNVLSYKEDPYVYTTLVNGSISLQPDNSSTSELILTPGHQAIFTKADCSTAVQQVKTDVVTSWRNGMFVFENQTLEQIMRQLSRWYDFSYEFSGKDVANTMFMGKMPRYGTFGEVLEILEKSGNLKFTASKNKIIIAINK